MSDHYLWDRSGAPDPEIERLERVLAPMRYRLQAPRPQRRVWPVAAAVAAIAAAVAIVAVVPRAEETSWQVAGAKLRKGQRVRTGASPVTIEAEAVGRVDLAPHSEMKATAEKKLTLARGEMHAFIWAPAREFVVDTPSARAVDLGCEYTLNVDANGDGLLRVKLGWVAFQMRDREAFIPAGALCVTHRKSGPGIPYYEDAGADVRNGVAALERGEEGALSGLLAAARPHDGITLWHLLTRVPERDRGAVFDRYRELVKLPERVTRDAVVRRDPKAIDECWNALDLENTGWWRGWERKWSE